MNGLAAHVRQAEVAAGMFEFQTFVIEAELMQQRGVEIMHMDASLDALQTNSSVDPCEYHGRNPPPASHTVNPCG